MPQNNYDSVAQDQYPLVRRQTSARVRKTAAIVALVGTIELCELYYSCRTHSFGIAFWQSLVLGPHAFLNAWHLARQAGQINSGEIPASAAAVRSSPSIHWALSSFFMVVLTIIVAAFTCLLIVPFVEHIKVTLTNILIFGGLAVMATVFWMFTIAFWRSVLSDVQVQRGPGKRVERNVYASREQWREDGEG